MGREAARETLESGRGLRAAIAAWKSAAAPIRGLRFHDLRHQAIAELAEGGASDATIETVAGLVAADAGALLARAHGSKRAALDKLERGLMRPASQSIGELATKTVN